MKKCKKCLKFKDRFEKQKLKGILYELNVCVDCRKIERKVLRDQRKKNPVKLQWLNCVIKDNNKCYNTSNLDEIEIIELKKLGYTIIFK